MATARHALRAEELLRAVIDGTPDAVFVKDREGRYLLINAAGAAFIGRPVEDIIGRDDTELFSPEAARVIQQGDRHVMATGESIAYDEEIAPPRAEPRVYLATKSPYLDRGGEVAGLIGIARDITKRKRAEEALAATRDELAVQVADMTHLHELTARLSSTAQIEPMLQEVLAAATGLTHADKGLIRLYDAERDALYPVASVGFDAEYLARMERVATSAYARAIGQGGTAIVEDIEAEPTFADYIETMLSGGYRAVAYTPLVAIGGDMVGTIAVYFAERHRPSEREIRLLELYAVQAAELIEHARLRAGAERERDLMTALARVAVEITGAGSVPEVLRIAAGEAHALAGARRVVLTVALDERGPPLSATSGEGGEVSVVVPVAGRDGEPLGRFEVYPAREGELPAQGRAVVVQLAQMAAVALEAVQLGEERAHIAHTLQASFLPPRLPVVPGLDVAARYRPAGRWNEAGGDFYDLFEAGDGRWLAVIGDVCGKGPEAAALTALVRYALRALAVRERQPAALMRLLNEAILSQRDDDRFCTVACCLLEPDAGGVRLTAASAGHPLPLVVRASGVVETAGAPGTLLGVLEDPSVTEAVSLLAAGDALVLYTDGLTDAWMPERALVAEELVAEVCGQTADAVEAAPVLESAVLAAGRGEPRDDIAVVVARVTAGSDAVAPPPVPATAAPVAELRLRLPCTPASVAATRAALGALERHVPADRLDDVRLLVSELVTNSVRHSGLAAGSDIELEARIAGDRLVVEVTDPGRGGGPTLRAKRPGEPSASGWGLFLVDSVADRWGVSRAGGTRVWFELRLG